MGNLNWIFKIKDYETHIKDVVKNNVDLNQVYEILNQYSGGLAFIELYSAFYKNQVTFKEQIIRRLGRVYALQNKHKPAKQIARELGVTPRTIFKWLEEK